MKKLLVALITGLVLSVTGVVFSGCNTTEEYKINFMIDGEEYVCIKTNGNEIIAMPDNPIKEGYVFLGWYLDNEVWEQPFTSITLFFNAIKEDIKVYSKWEVKGTKGLSYELNEEETGYILTNLGSAMEENIIIPIEHNNLPVVAIKHKAFNNCTWLTSITIPNSVTSIGAEAFNNCSSLEAIEIPDSVTSIGSSAFSYCSSLTSIEIPNSVISIGDWAFYNCESLTSIEIPNSVTSIGSYAFTDCTSLTSITIPNSVTSIGGFAFYNCSSLTSVVIGSGVTSIGDFAFSGCSSLTSVVIGSGVTSIGEHAISFCSSLTSVVIGNGVTSIGNFAFYNCSLLTIYCEAESKPSGWDSSWNISNRPVVWGYKGNNPDINE